MQVFLQSLNPGGRLIEVILLGISLKACFVMWIIARRTKHDDEFADYDDKIRGGDNRAQHEAVYRRLRNLYLSVYACATFGDWIQGGFLYALYAEYGYTMRQIGLIFVGGSGSAATVGTFVSALGDTRGHRRNCVLYGVLYAMSCLLCNFKSLVPLLLGRLLGGIAYSILYTSFESWLIAEADAKGLPVSLLARLFSVATFSNAGSAVIAGMAGHLAVEVIPHTRTSSLPPSTSPLSSSSSPQCSPPCDGRSVSDRDGSGRSGSALGSLCDSVRAIRRSRALIFLGLVNRSTRPPVRLRFPMDARAGGAPPSRLHVARCRLIFSIFMLSKMAGLGRMSARLSRRPSSSSSSSARPAASCLSSSPPHTSEPCSRSAVSRRYSACTGQPSRCCDAVRSTIRRVHRQWPSSACYSMFWSSHYCPLPAGCPRDTRGGLP